MNRRLVHLDMIRGLAALAVCASHLRAFLFVDFGEVKVKSALVSLVYAITGFGHQSVMIFFVLSGFFIGGSVADAWQNSRWSWVSYASQRLTRLWVVLLPALVLTLAWDHMGRWLTNGAGYDGRYYAFIHSGPSTTQTCDLSFSTLLGNAMFLQTVMVPPYGTNGPLWSLANEFWYYVLFPLAVLGACGEGWGRYVSITMALLTILWLPHQLLAGGIVWLYGVGAYLLWRYRTLWPYLGSPWWLCVAGVACASSVAASRKYSWYGSDYIIGATFALVVPGLAMKNMATSMYRKAAELLSDTSYTLYVTHFPFLAFVFYVFFLPTKHYPDWRGSVLFVVILAGALLYAKVVWWCFERNTHLYRRRLHSGLSRWGVRG